MGRRIGLILLWKTRVSSSSSSPISFFSSSRNPNRIVGKSGTWKAWFGYVKPSERHYTITMPYNGVVWRKFMCNLGSSGRNFWGRCCMGMSVIAGTTYMSLTNAYAMGGNDILVGQYPADHRDSSGFLEEDLDDSWALARRFQLPFVLLVMVILGWQYPVTLVIKIALLLLCTRPSPYSVYIPIEQLRKEAVHKDPELSQSKLFYARKVDVQDYKFLCTANVELRDKRLCLVGVLGSWWIINSSNDLEDEHRCVLKCTC